MPVFRQCPVSGTARRSGKGSLTGGAMKSLWAAAACGVRRLYLPLFPSCVFCVFCALLFSPSSPALPSSRLGALLSSQPSASFTARVGGVLVLLCVAQQEDYVGGHWDSHVSSPARYGAPSSAAASSGEAARESSETSDGEDEEPESVTAPSLLRSESQDHYVALPQDVIARLARVPLRTESNGASVAIGHQPSRDGLAYAPADFGESQGAPWRATALHSQSALPLHSSDGVRGLHFRGAETPLQQSRASSFGFSGGAPSVYFLLPRSNASGTGSVQSAQLSGRASEDERSVEEETPTRGFYRHINRESLGRPFSEKISAQLGDLYPRGGGDYSSAPEFIQKVPGASVPVTAADPHYIYSLSTPASRQREGNPLSAIPEHGASASSPAVLLRYAGDSVPSERPFGTPPPADSPVGFRQESDVAQDGVPRPQYWSPYAGLQRGRENVFVTSEGDQKQAGGEGNLPRAREGGGAVVYGQGPAQGRRHYPQPGLHSLESPSSTALSFLKSLVPGSAFAREVKDTFLRKTEEAKDAYLQLGIESVAAAVSALFSLTPTSRERLDEDGPSSEARDPCVSTAHVPSRARTSSREHACKAKRKRGEGMVNASSDGEDGMAVGARMFAMGIEEGIATGRTALQKLRESSELEDVSTRSYGDGKRRRKLPPYQVQVRKKMVTVDSWYTRSLGATMNGRRKDDEDALLVYSPLAGFPNARLVGLFDGHAGYEISRFCATHATDIFGAMADFSAESFKDACLALDDAALHQPGPVPSSGSTGIILVLEQKWTAGGQIFFHLHAANVGDSRALLLRQDGSFIVLSEDHRPNNPAERKRIESAGGRVERKRNGIWRVDGFLALSRAFGDFMLKQESSLPADAQRVVAVPDVLETIARPGDILLLACDGMFEARGMTWEAVAAILKKSIDETHGDLAQVAYRMLDAAFFRGSRDNISVIIIRFENYKHTVTTVSRFDFDAAGIFHFCDSAEAHEAVEKSVCSCFDFLSPERASSLSAVMDEPSPM
ncbi:hypothetical protein BESB_036010 [Besnoitia besnoiti]|uniref:PPM-type phosphatase domain-containing protein n=1 Tax=Besnoitia besnoiti TaxID=94643 RepID=A0A2A9MMU6_BESBE|nr:hypothetical protein BESB_036010 [Besnoitia besnoiti]PFH37143.1 hypothetical protein BESB_036010 [Besnoitia besnoiti]